MGDHPNDGRLNVSVASAVIIENEKGEILLLKQVGTDLWGPPAGGLHPHEDVIQTAVRETKEETGLDVKIQSVVSIKTVDRGDEASGQGFTFNGKITGGHLDLDKNEVDDFFWCDVNTVLNMIETKRIYKPEYNIDAFKKWMNGLSFPLEVFTRM